MTEPNEATRVLLVDDDSVFLDRAYQALALLTDLRAVHTGRAALMTLPIWKPNVILFDLLMEDLDGFQFLDAISRWTPGNRPFILCTTDGRGADTRVRPLANWHVGTLVRSSSIYQLRMAVMQAAQCQEPPA